MRSGSVSMKSWGSEGDHLHEFAKYLNRFYQILTKADRDFTGKHSYFSINFHVNSQKKLKSFLKSLPRNYKLLGQFIH